MFKQFIDFLKKIPIPICGLILGAVSLGNLLFSIGYQTVGNVYAAMGSFLMGLIMLKIIFAMKHTMQTLNDPIVASVSPTFTMAWMVICVFLNRLFPDQAWIHGVWLLAVLLHFVLMIYFVGTFVVPVKVELTHIYPSWFITFVGLGVIPNTSKAFFSELGTIVIWVALFFYLILLPIILKRVFILKKMHESTLPLITIIAAPGSLCLAGYLSVMEQTSDFVVVLLLLLSQLLYVGILSLLPKLLKIKFYPSYAAFTFPLVISATAINSVANLFHEILPLKILASVEIVIATIVVTYVLIRYVRFLIRSSK